MLKYVKVQLYNLHYKSRWMPGVSEPLTNAKAPGVAGVEGGELWSINGVNYTGWGFNSSYLCPQQELLCVCHWESACGLFAPQMAPFWMPFWGQHPFPRIALHGLRLGKGVRACGGHKRKVELMEGVMWDLEGQSSYLMWNTTQAWVITLSLSLATSWAPVPRHQTWNALILRAVRVIFHLAFSVWSALS